MADEKEPKKVASHLHRQKPVSFGGDDEKKPLIKLEDPRTGGRANAIARIWKAWFFPLQV